MYKLQFLRLYLLKLSVRICVLQCPIDYSVPRQHYNADNADGTIAAEYGGYTGDYYIGAYSSDTVWVYYLTTSSGAV